MAFFGSSKSEKQSVTEETKVPDAPSAPQGNGSTIVECIEILGNIRGCGTIHVEGKIHGDLTVDESVIIGKNGVVNGDIKSKKVIVSGKVNGTTKCDTLEVTQTGYLTDTIEARVIVSDGKIEGSITKSESIHITRNGHVQTSKMMGKHIMVNGSIEGNVIATELLEINKDGRVKGEMQVKKIKVSEGGLMLGTMLTYEQDNEVRKVEKKPVTSAVVKNEQANGLKEIVKTKEK